MSALFDAKAFSAQLHAEITARNIDMKTAAKEIGCSASSVTRICQGKSPNVENYLRICKWLSARPTKALREGWHYDHDGYCDNPARGY